jgi:hypothetical protein
MMKRTSKNVFATSLAAILLFVFTACDSNKTGQSASEQTAEEHTGHTETGASVADVPDYSAVSGEVKEQIRKTYQSYISLKNTLVAAKPDEAKQAAQALQANAEKITTAPIEGEAKAFINEQVNMINQHARQIANSGEIEAQRGQFDMLSSSLYAIMKATDANKETAYYQYCPMANNDKGAYWISENKEIRNPYFGDKMLTCGENKETLAAQ